MRQKWMMGVMPLGAAGALMLAECGEPAQMAKERPDAPSAAAAVDAPIGGTGPAHILSLNLCSDQYVVGLADRSQIAGLTRNVVDPEMSAVADQAKGLPIFRHSAEEILQANPDLIVGMPASGSGALAAIKGHDYPLLDLPWANDVDDIYAAIRVTAKAVGHAERGDQMIAAMTRALADVPRTGKGRVAVYYQRRGFMTGTGTLVDDMMGRVGLVNLAKRMNKPILAQMSLEEMVQAQPDFIIMESATAVVNDHGSEMLHHPALRGVPRLYLREAWTVCGGPAYVQAVQSLSQQMARHDAGLVAEPRRTGRER
jgi:iron complex transport system substrate-binding protein